MSDAHSNTAVFALREVNKGGRRMRGVFALRAIAGAELPLWIGVYPGRLITPVQSALKRERYAARHGLTRKPDIQRATAYNRAADELEFDAELDPSDADGNLLPEFADHLVLYLNEPAPGQMVNSVFVFNHAARRYEAWLTAPLAADAEALVGYGRHYWRDYDVDDSALQARLRHMY